MADQKKKIVLFLGTSNYCRSRLAEIIFNSVTTKMRLSWLASSRGLALEQGVNNIGAMDASAIKALEAMGIRPGDAISRSPMSLAEHDLEAADRVIGLHEGEHRPMLQERFPNWIEKTEFWCIGDASDSARSIEREMMNLIARILGGGNRPEGALPSAPNSERVVATEPQRKQITLKVGRETAGRKGKGVTTVFDMPLNDKTVLELAATLKNRCGTGGTVKDGRIEIQGDQRERIVAELEKLGYKVKRVGG